MRGRTVSREGHRNNDHTERGREGPGLGLCLVLGGGHQERLPGGGAPSAELERVLEHTRAHTSTGTRPGTAVRPALGLSSEGNGLCLGVASQGRAWEVPGLLVSTGPPFPPPPSHGLAVCDVLCEGTRKARQQLGRKCGPRAETRSTEQSKQALLPGHTRRERWSPSTNPAAVSL